MTVERIHSGAYVISDMIGGYLVSRTFYDYNKRDAMRLFRAEMRDAR